MIDVTKHFLRIFVLAAFMIASVQSSVLAAYYTIVNDSDRAVVRCTYRSADGKTGGNVYLPKPIPPNSTGKINVSTYDNRYDRYMVLTFYFERNSGSNANYSGQASKKVDSRSNSTIHIKKSGYKFYAS